MARVFCNEGDGESVLGSYMEALGWVLGEELPREESVREARHFDGERTAQACEKPANAKYRQRWARFLEREQLWLTLVMIL